MSEREKEEEPIRPDEVDPNWLRKVRREREQEERAKREREERGKREREDE